MIPIPCAAHVSEPAAWTCGDCGRALCPRCGAEAVYARVHLVRCVHCGGVARLLLVPPTLQPWWTMGPELRKTLTSPDGLIQIAAIAGLMYLFQLLPIVGGILSFAALVSYVLLVVRHGTEGGITLPQPDDRTASTFGGSLGRALFATLVLWLPGVLFILATEGQDGLEAWPSSFKHPRSMVFFGLAGLALLPASIVVAATGESVPEMANPWAMLRLPLRAPLQYLFAWSACAGLFALSLGLGAASQALIHRVPFPILLPFLGICAAIAPLLVAALILGRFVYENGLAHTAVGWVPQVLAPAPLGRLPDIHRRTPAPEPEELPVDEGIPPADSYQAPRHDPDDLPTDFGNIARAEPEIAPPEPPAGDREPFHRARTLESEGRSAEAADLLRRAAASDPRGPHAAEALFEAGRLLAAHPARRREAAALLRHVAGQYSRDPFAARASELLATLDAA